MVSVVPLGPRLVGWKRITMTVGSPGPIARGYEATDGRTKSADDDVISDISSRLNPVLLIVRIWSAKEFRQTRPKSPAPLSAVTMIGAGASAARGREPSMRPQPVQASHPGPPTEADASGVLPESLLPNRTSWQMAGPCR